MKRDLKQRFKLAMWEMFNEEDKRLHFARTGYVKRSLVYAMVPILVFLLTGLAEALVSIQFEYPTYTVKEDGGTATIKVTKVGSNYVTVSVHYNTSNGTAAAGSDYTAASGTLAWSALDSSNKSFIVQILQDSAVEGDETVNLTLSNPSGGAVLGSPHVAVLTIEDVVPPTLQFSLSTYTVKEDGGTATITVKRTGSDTGAVSVHYSTSNGTAAAGSDYTAASGTLAWGDGDSANKSFIVQILQDSAVEGDETVNLSLSNPSGGAILGSPSTAVLTIEDVIPPTLQFSLSSYTIKEDGGMATITVKRTGSDTGAVSVHYSTSNGTAAAGSDYTAASGTLAWGDGDSANKSFVVQILQDAAVEGDETVNLSLSNPSGGAVLGSPSTAVLTIEDVIPPTLFGLSAIYLLLLSD